MTCRDNAVKESARQFDKHLQELQRRHAKTLKESARRFDEQVRELNCRHNNAMKVKEDEPNPAGAQKRVLGIKHTTQRSHRNASCRWCQAGGLAVPAGAWHGVQLA